MFTVSGAYTDFRNHLLHGGLFSFVCSPSVPLKQVFFPGGKSSWDFLWLLGSAKPERNIENFFLCGEEEGFPEVQLRLQNGQEGFKCFSFCSFSKHGKLNRSHLHLSGEGIIANVNFTGQLGAFHSQQITQTSRVRLSCANPTFKLERV